MLKKQGDISMNKRIKEPNRYYDYIDILRVLAIAAVLLQHSATYYIDGGYGNVYVANFFRGISRWNILIFIMISGGLVLSKERTIETIWKKYIARIVKVFLAWSLLYTIYNFCTQYSSMGVADMIKNTISSLVSGGTQRMWYLVMLIGIYAITPILQKTLKCLSAKEMSYLLLLLFVVSVIFPTMTFWKPFETVMGINYNRIELVYPNYPLFYFVLGYWLFLNIGNGIFSKVRTVYIFLVGGGALLIIGLLHITREEMIDTSFFLNTIVCVGVYILAYRLSKFENIVLKKIIHSMAECSFGIYLTHTFVQYFLNLTRIEKNIFSLPSVVGIFGYCVVCLLMSWGITYIMRKTKLREIVS